MSHTSWTNNFSTTTSHDDQTALLRMERDEGQFIVSDLLGLRFGVGETLKEALIDWIDGVTEFVDWLKGQRLGLSLASEIDRYRRFLELGGDPE